MLDVQFGQASDFGKVRTNNEDAMGSFIPSSRQQGRSHGFLFVVADGVGGMDLGEVASATAVSVMTEQFAKATDGKALTVAEELAELTLPPEEGVPVACAVFVIEPLSMSACARRRY